MWQRGANGTKHRPRQFDQNAESDCGIQNRIDQNCMVVAAGCLMSNGNQNQIAEHIPNAICAENWQSSPNAAVKEQPNDQSLCQEGREHDRVIQVIKHPAHQVVRKVKKASAPKLSTLFYSLLILVCNDKKAKACLDSSRPRLVNICRHSRSLARRVWRALRDRVAATKNGRIRRAGRQHQNRPDDYFQYVLHKNSLPFVRRNR